MAPSAHMATKKPRSQPDLGGLTRIVERGFASVAGDFAATKEHIGDLKTEMMEQFEHVDTQFGATDDRLRSISSELAAIHPPGET
jgi:hypothetical protein